MKRRSREIDPSSAPSTPNRRRFLSTLAVGAAYTACERGHHPPRPVDSAAPGPGMPPPPPSPQPPPPGPRPPEPDARAPGDMAAQGQPPDAAPAGAGGLTPKSARDRVVLGATGIVVSRLAMGSGTHGSGGTSAQTRLGVPAFARLLVEGYHEQGITFWETADQYGSHPHLKEAIRQVGRQNVVVLTKTHARTQAQMQADLDRFRTELGTDYIDIVLLHNRQSATWTTECAGAMEVLSGAKQRGDVRAHGVSCHTLAALRLAARTPWVDVDLARINPAGVEMDADPATVIGVLREMKAARKGIIGMKILGVGQLAGAARIDMAIRHAIRLDAIDAFTIGFTTRPHLDAVVTKISQTSVG